MVIPGLKLNKVFYKKREEVSIFSATLPLFYFFYGFAGYSSLQAYSVPSEKTPGNMVATNRSFAPFLF